ncbi:MAG: hypothetical protein CMI19_00245 [Opitutae bacterium]|nr:hypothetical protein [Opitutae bacterium]
MGKGLLYIQLFVYLFSSLQAEEPFRVFKTPSGKSFEGKVVGYEGQTFILTNKSNQLFQVPFNALSNADKAYLVEGVRAKRIPKGRPAPQPIATPGAKGVDFHSEIMPILQQRCNDCHKAPYEENGRTKNPKAGLRFDTYDWLMKGSEDIGPIIEAGDTDASILFEVITLPPDDDMIMPPKGDPLTAEQIDLFRRWILEGATEKPSGKVAPTAVAKSSSPEETKDGSSKDDKIHKAPPKKKQTFRPGSFFAHVVVPLGVSPDEALAKIQGSKPKPGEPIDFDRHVLPILEERCNSCHHAPFDRSGRLVNPKASLRFDSFAQVMKGNLDGPVIVANDLEKSRLYSVLNLPEDDDLFMPPKGGPMDQEQKDVIKRWIEEGANPSKNSVSATKGGIPAPDEPVSFNNHILPLLENRCLNCHGEPYVKNGRTIKPTAGLQLDTYEMVMKGNLDGTIVTPGDPTVSTLFQVVILPDDDPELMPPKGDPLTEDERTMIKRWILEGASEQPAAEAADPNAAPKPKEKVELAVGTVDAKISVLDMLAKRVSVPSKTQIEAAQKTYALVTQLSERNPLLRAEFSSFAGEIDDSALGALGSIKNNITQLDFSRTKMSDTAMRAAGGMQHLTWLSARNTIVSDNGIKSLSSLKFLSYLNLSGTNVTDRGLKDLSALKTLEEIYLWGSKVTENGVKDLRAALPNTKIIF